MKSTKFIICLCMAGSVFLSACGQEAKTPDTADLNPGSVEQTVNEETGEPAESEEADVSEPTDAPEEADETKQADGAEQTGGADELQSRELTQEEIAFFDEYLSLSGNWGFLLSTYETAEEIDLNELFYSGAGISNYSLTEEEAADYLNASGDAEIYTDVVHLTTAEIDGFLLEKTGLSLAQMQKPLDWVYSAETDTWYHQAGDTNWRPFECVGGMVADDVYTLYMQTTDTWSGYDTETYETVLKKNGDAYLFVSNLLTE